MCVTQSPFLPEKISYSVVQRLCPCTRSFCLHIFVCRNEESCNNDESDDDHREAFPTPHTSSATRHQNYFKKMFDFFFSRTNFESLIPREGNRRGTLSKVKIERKDGNFLSAVIFRRSFISTKRIALSTPLFTSFSL